MCLHRPFASRLLGFCVALCTLWASAAAAQDESVITPIPEIRPAPPDTAEWLGKPVVSIEVVNLGQRWRTTSTVQRVRLGEPYSGEVARRAMRELLDTGLYANANVDVQLDAQGVRLTIRVEPRRIVREILLLGSPIAEDTLLEAAHLHSDVELAENELPKITARLQSILAAHGFPAAKVQIDVAAADNPLETNLVVRIEPGQPALITKRRFRVSPVPDAPGLSAVLSGYGLQTGDRADEEQLERADHDLERELRHQGWHRATVSHQVVRSTETTHLDIIVRAGAYVTLEFEGLQSFDADQLLLALDLDNNEDM